MLDAQLSVDPDPILPPAGPLFRNIHHCQMQHLEGTFIRRKDGFYLCCLAELPVEVLDGIGHVDEPLHLFRVLEVGAEELSDVLCCGRNAVFLCARMDLRPYGKLYRWLCDVCCAADYPDAYHNADIP